MSNVQQNINKITKALKAKCRMPLINQEQFYGENGPVTKYIIHYGKPKGKTNNTIAEVFGKVNLLKVLRGFIPLVVDGVYGTKTKEAVLQYWKLLGWKPSTGWSVGVNTKKALIDERTV